MKLRITATYDIDVDDPEESVDTALEELRADDCEEAFEQLIDAGQNGDPNFDIKVEKLAD